MENVERQDERVEPDHVVFQSLGVQGNNVEGDNRSVNVTEKPSSDEDPQIPVALFVPEVPVTEEPAIPQAESSRERLTPEVERRDDDSGDSADSDNEIIAKHPRHLRHKDPKFSEHEMRVCTHTDSVVVINSLRNKPVEKSRLRIPLCRLRRYHKVCPILEADVKKLENEFTRGYREGDRVLYVSLYDDGDKDLLVDDKIVTSWNSHWVDANDCFESDLAQDPQLHQFKGKMFYVYEGNHRITAWMRHIADHHNDHPTWHISVECIILDGRGRNGPLLNAMEDINW